MKRNEVMAIIATSLMLFALCLSASAKDRNEKVINYSTRIDDDIETNADIPEEIEIPKVDDIAETQDENQML